MFQRPAGAGGSSALEGTFAVRSAPLPAQEVRPKDYYLYEGPLLEELLAEEMENMKSAAEFFRNLCQKAACTK